MSSVEVTAVVTSIISAFASGMDIFKRMKGKQKPKKSRKQPERSAEEEWQLQYSLQHRPQQIRVEHDRSLARFGTRFAVGDIAAQTSLNHTLLVLNTGLIQILSCALSKDTKEQALSRRSLLNLSENAAADAIKALEQLHSRLSSPAQAAPPIPPRPIRKGAKRCETSPKASFSTTKAGPASKPRSKSYSSTERQRPGPDPLVRGAWIRSRSGTSVIAASTPSSGPAHLKPSHQKAASNSSPPSRPAQPALPSRPSHQRTKSSPAASSKSNQETPSFPPLDQERFFTAQSPPPPSYHSTSEQSPRHHIPLLNRAPSLLVVSPDVFSDTSPPGFSSSTSFPLQVQSPPYLPPAPPPKIPIPARHNINPNTDLQSTIRPHPRPPSIATFQTFLTASTKIGEIPERRGHAADNNPTPAATPWTDQQWQGRRPGPYVIPPRLEDEEPPREKRKGGLRGLRFWKKGNSNSSGGEMGVVS